MKTKQLTYEEIVKKHHVIYDYWAEMDREKETGVFNPERSSRYSMEEFDHMCSALDADKYELCRRMYPGFKRIWRWVQPADPYPGDKWEDEFDIIMVNFAKWMPDLFGPDDTPVRIREGADIDNVGRAQACLQKLGMFIIGRLGCEHINKIKKEMEQRGGENVVNVEEVIAELDVDLVTAEEIEPLLPELNLKQIGRILGGLGCDKIRIGSYGPSQWVWAIDNVEKYKAMKPREVKEIWLNQGSNESVSFM